VKLPYLHLRVFNTWVTPGAGTPPLRARNRARHGVGNPPHVRQIDAFIEAVRPPNPLPSPARNKGLLAPPENWSTADVVVASCVGARVGATSRRPMATSPAKSLSQPLPNVAGGPSCAGCLTRQMVHLNSRGTKQSPNQ
jgi:hypothetical protein